MNHTPTPKTLVAALTAILTFCQGSLHAEPISLNQALYEAIESNISLRIQAYQRFISEQDLEFARAKFDSSFFANLSVAHEQQDWTSSESDRSSSSLGIRKSLSSGASVSLQSRLLKNEGSRFDSSLNQQIGGSLSHTSGITLSIRQPLLQGFGKAVNLASIQKAETQLAIARLEYKNELLDAINLTEKAYWQVAYEKARLEYTQSSISLAENLLKETEIRYENGLATRLDLLQSRANLATQRETIFDAQRSLREAEDQLLVAMGRLIPGYQDTELMVSPLVDPEARQPTLAEVWAGALENDIALLVQESNLESLGFDRVSARDRMRPALDVVLSGSTVGYSAERSSKAAWGAFEPDGHDWSAGLELSVPIGRRTARAQLNQVEAIIEREQLRIDQIQQSLFVSVRQAWRNYQISLEKLQAARITLELQRESFEQEQAKYSEGLAVFRDVQQAQQSLDRAGISELTAWLSALRALADLSRLDGSLLERHRIDLNFL